MTYVCMQDFQQAAQPQLAIRDEKLSDIAAREHLLDAAFGPTRFKKRCNRFAIGLTLGGLHDLAGEEALEFPALLVVTSTEIGPFLGAFSNQPVDDSFECGGIHRLEAEFGSEPAD
jgi:hypothetical protein